MKNGVKRILKSKDGSTQGRMDSFFKPAVSPSVQNKRKVREREEGREKWGREIHSAICVAGRV